MICLHPAAPARICTLVLASTEREERFVALDSLYRPPATQRAPARQRSIHRHPSQQHLQTLPKRWAINAKPTPLLVLLSGTPWYGSDRCWQPQTNPILQALLLLKTTHALNLALHCSQRAHVRRRTPSTTRISCRHAVFRDAPSAHAAGTMPLHCTSPIIIITIAHYCPLFTIYPF